MGNMVFGPFFLGGGNSDIFKFHPDPWGFMIQFDSDVSNGLVQPPTGSMGMVYLPT